MVSMHDALELAACTDRTDQSSDRLADCLIWTGASTSSPHQREWPVIIRGSSVLYRSVGPYQSFVRTSDRWPRTKWIQFSYSLPIALSQSLASPRFAGSRGVDARQCWVLLPLAAAAAVAAVVDDDAHTRAVLRTESISLPAWWPPAKMGRRHRDVQECQF